MICLDKTTTGDGLVSALQVLAIMKRSGNSACLSQLVSGMSRYPQKMLNVATERKIDPDSSAPIQEAVAQAEVELADSGRGLCSGLQAPSP